MTNAISIIIPNYNGAHLLRLNLPSVLGEALRYSKDTKVFVIDDGSSDESIAMLREEFPDVQLVRHEKNRGFAEAIYTGVQVAETELLFLLNSDVQLSANCIAPMVNYFNELDTFSVCPLIVNEEGVINRHSWNVRNFRNGSLKPIAWDLDQAKLFRQDRKLATLYASGGSMMVRKSMFMELQGFHPLFKPFYGEDYDLGLRAWRMGWKSYFEPNVRIVHQERGSIKENIKRAHVLRIRRRNKYILEWMHLPAWRLWFNVIPLSLLQLLGELLLMDKVNLLGFCAAVPKIPAVIAARRELKLKQLLSLSLVIDYVSEQLKKS